MTNYLKYFSTLIFEQHMSSAVALIVKCDYDYSVAYKSVTTRQTHAGQTDPYSRSAKCMQHTND